MPHPDPSFCFLCLCLSAPPPPPISHSYTHTRARSQTLCARLTIQRESRIKDHRFCFVCLWGGGFGDGSAKLVRLIKERIIYVFHGHRASSFRHPESLGAEPVSSICNLWVHSLYHRSAMRVVRAVHGVGQMAEYHTDNRAVCCDLQYNRDPPRSHHHPPPPPPPPPHAVGRSLIVFFTQL